MTDTTDSVPQTGERLTLALDVAAPGTVGVPGAAPFLIVGDADAGVCVDGVCALPGTTSRA